MSATTTSLELTNRAQTPRPPRPEEARDGTDDPVLSASRLADSEVPDGGYGWVIVPACSVLAWWTMGTTYSWGVMQDALVLDGLSSPAVLSFIGGLSTGLVGAMAIVNSWVIRGVGVRCAGMVGITFIGGSEILSSFAVKNLGALFFTSGVLLGVGISISFMVLSVIPAQYFSAKRGLANGLVFAGGGFGGAAISLSIDALVRKLGVAWAYRILGLATLATGLPAAWLVKERTQTRSPVFVEWRLFKSLTFDIIFLASAIGTFPLFVPPFFLPLFTRQLDLPSGAGAGLLAGFNLASAAGRILCGIFCDRLGPLNTLFAVMLATAVSMLTIWPASTSLGPLVLFVIINGLANGGFFSTMPTVVGNVFGSARVSVAMGMTVTGWAAGYLMGAPIAGYILSANGGAEAGLPAFRPAMFYAGTLAAFSGVLVAVVRLRMNSAFAARL